MKLLVNFLNFYQSQNVEFTLYLTSHFSQNTRKIETRRDFTIDTGSLVSGAQINNVIRRNDDKQDELHYYYIEIEKPQEKLVIELNLTDQSTDVDLLVKLGSFPQFNYKRLKKPDGIDINIYRGKEDNQGTEQVVINNPQIGTYFIAVVVNPNLKKSNVNYSISANSIEKPKSSRASGCSLGKNNKIDLTFYLLIFISIFYINAKKRPAIS